MGKCSKTCVPHLQDLVHCPVEIPKQHDKVLKHIKFNSDLISVPTWIVF